MLEDEDGDPAATGLRGDLEGGWNAIQITKAIAEIAAPIIALILAFLGFIALFRKQK